MKSNTIDLFALGVKNSKAAKPIDRTKGFLNVEVFFEIAKLNLTQAQKPVKSTK